MEAHDADGDVASSFSIAAMSFQPCNILWRRTPWHTFDSQYPIIASPKDGILLPMMVISHD